MSFLIRHRNNLIVMAIFGFIATFIIMLKLDDIETNRRLLNVFMVVNIFIATIACVSFIRLYNRIVNAKASTVQNQNLLDASTEKVLTTFEKELVTDKMEVEQSVNEKELEQLEQGLKGTNTVEAFAEKMLENLVQYLDIAQGMIFFKEKKENVFKMIASHEFITIERVDEFKIGEGLHGQAAMNREAMVLNNLKKEYLTILSGSDIKYPNNLLIVPVVYMDNTIGIIELASFKGFNSYMEKLIVKFAERVNEDLSNLLT